MAHSGRFTSEGLDFEGVRRSAKRPSPTKFFYEPGTTPEALRRIGTTEPLEEAMELAYGEEALWEYLGINPIRIGPHGLATVLPIGANPFEHPATARDIQKHEKATVVTQSAVWNAEGWKHKGRNKPDAKGRLIEWDNVVLFSLSRSEVSRLSADQMSELMRIVVDEVRQSQLSAQNGNVTGHGLGFKDVIVLPVHGDTDHVHMQAFVNRIPWNFDAKASGSAEKDTGIWDAFRANVNLRLSEAGIDIQLADQPSPVLARRAEPDDVREVVKTLEEAGVDVHPELTAGPVRGRRFQPVAVDELEKAEAEVVAELLEIERRKSILTGAARQIQGAKAAMLENEALKAEQERLQEQIADLEKKAEEAAQQLAELDELRQKILNDLADALENGENLASSLNKAEEELAGVRAQLEVKSRELADLESQMAIEVEARSQAETLLERARSQVETLSAQLSSVTAERDEFKGAADEYQAQSVALGEQVETLTGSLSEAEAENRRLAAEVESLNVAVETMRADHAAFREMVTQAAEAAAEEPAGHGMSAIGMDTRIRKAVEYPAGVAISRSMFRTRLTLPDGSVVTASDKYAKLTKGTMSEAAIAAMVAHAQREGWQPISISATDMKTHSAIAEAVRAAGLTVEGEETAATVAPAPVREAPEVPAAPAAPAATVAVSGRGFPEWVRLGRAETDEEQKALEAAYERWKASTLKKADDLMAQSAAQTDKAAAAKLAQEAEALRERANTWTTDQYLAFRHSTYQARIEALRWRERTPDEWTDEQRRAAREAFKAANVTNVTLNEWAESQHRIWRSEHPEEAARLDAEREGREGRNTPKPE